MQLPCWTRKEEKRVYDDDGTSILRNTNWDSQTVRSSIGN